MHRTPRARPCVVVMRVTASDMGTSFRNRFLPESPRHCPHSAASRVDPSRYCPSNGWRVVGPPPRFSKSSRRRPSPRRSAGELRLDLLALAALEGELQRARLGLAGHAVGHLGLEAVDPLRVLRGIDLERELGAGAGLRPEDLHGLA